MIATSPPVPERLLLKPKDAAAALSISERSLWSLCKSGRIPVIRIGRSVRYDMRDLVAYIDAQKTGGAK